MSFFDLFSSAPAIQIASKTTTMEEDTSFFLSKWWNGVFHKQDDRTTSPLPADMYGSQKMQVGDRFRIIYVAKDRRDQDISPDVLLALRKKIESDPFFVDKCTILDVRYDKASDRVFCDFEVIKNPWPLILAVAAIVSLAIAVGMIFEPEKMIPLLDNSISSIKYIAIAAGIYFVYRAIQVVKT